MNHITLQFIEKYDSDLDMFHIEEVQDEYEEFKEGVKNA